MNIFLILILIYLSTTSAINDTKLTLEEWYNEISANHPKVAQGNPFSLQLNEINNKKWCINDAINIFNYKLKVLNYAEANILIYGAGMNCLSTKDFTWKQLIKMLADHYSIIMPENKVCFMLELEKFQPKSTALWNFNSANLEIDAAACDDVVDNSGYAEHLKNIESVFGNLDELTCGAVNGNSLKKLLLTIVVLSSGEVDQYTDYNTNLLAKEASKMLDDAFKCVKSRMISSGHQWMRSTVATTKTTQQRPNNNKSSENRDDSLTGERVFWYAQQKWFDVHQFYGRKYLRANGNWVQIIKNNRLFSIEMKP
ncbi:hypothetical protein ACKWTF_014815 [Chironomus riparius]